MKEKERICKNCKYWENSDIGSYYGCKKGEYGECSSNKFCYQESNKDEKDNLVYWDYEGYSAGVMTGSDFGCVHFEPREVKNV